MTRLLQNHNLTITNEEINALPLGAFEGKTVVVSEEKKLFTLLERQLSSAHDLTGAKETVRKLRFLEKLGEEIDLAAEILET